MLQERSWNLALSVTLIVYAYMAWLSIGYYEVSVLVLVWILVVIAGLLAINATTHIIPAARSALIYSALFVSMILMLAISLKYVSSYYLEDEILIQNNAAYLFVHGQDPYVRSNMLKMFYSSQVPLFNTPMLEGGYVYYLIYPGLSVLLFVPSILFHFNPDYMIAAFNFISIVLLIYYYRKKKLKLQTPLIITAIMVSAFYFGFTVAGVSAIIWVTLLAMAYIFRDRPYISGIMFGLSVAYKQDPAIVFPFLLYFIYKEYGGSHAMKFVVAIVISFFAVNLPFIVMGPMEWITSILSVANQNIIGVGVGPSIISFAGFYHVNPLYFSSVVLILELFLLFLYIRYYNALKYAFFAFPVIVMLFNFRVLISYLMYWPFLVMIVLPDINIQENMLKPLHVKKSHFIALSLVLIVVTGGFTIPLHSSSGSMAIKSIDASSDTISIPNIIDRINITISYEPGNGYPASIPAYFRILTDSAMENYSVNGLLWHANAYLHPGENNISIYPDNSFDLLPSNTSFILIAYYGQMQASYRSPGLYDQPEYPVPDPMFLYPEYSKSEPFPGWQARGNGVDIAYDAQGFNMSSAGWANLTSSIIAGTQDLQNLTLYYNISGSGVYGYVISFSVFNYTVSSDPFSVNLNYTYLIVNKDQGTIKLKDAYEVASEYKWPLNSIRITFFTGPASSIRVEYVGAAYD
ncbi:hypothetical membrane protein [Thermoplasma acidophilum]|uniref:Hypothetical membrane protein n=1 Tax=Thermoplasma acidophilum (strain ATCC 25905 / DSM 1728 / JCM 9062 / NBRC 15155 / AMRC-C165) TaxID=273075 RepID=Q9HJV1_THEAC|nr:glycosyltransferase family 87 protein [Thermoplasma acidophilum]MCY0851158.1 glycosyltransferase family 87 protein [Thermoplasma acidophilum]CAC11991.1 hypothetical membrane protein [Thermoplasma acidophilum]